MSNHDHKLDLKPPLMVPRSHSSTSIYLSNDEEKITVTVWCYKGRRPTFSPQDYSLRLEKHEFAVSYLRESLIEEKAEALIADLQELCGSEATQSQLPSSVPRNYVLQDFIIMPTDWKLHED